VDPESIIAFRQRSGVDFPAVPNEAFQIAPELAVLEQEFRKLRDELQRQMVGNTQGFEAQPQVTGVAV
jgi:hypothetical protein